jgi:hypothetical protein
MTMSGSSGVCSRDSGGLGSWVTFLAMLSRDCFAVWVQAVRMAFTLAAGLVKLSLHNERGTGDLIEPHRVKLLRRRSLNEINLEIRCFWSC